MNSIKISELWTAGIETIQNSIFFKLLQQISNKPISFTKPSKADILIIGPYNLNRIPQRINKFILRKLNNSKINETYELYYRKLLFSKNRPLTLFYCHENIRYDRVQTDFQLVIYSPNNKNHLRFPIWKILIGYLKIL